MTVFAFGSDPYARYLQAREEMDRAYRELTVAQRFSANLGAVIGFIISLVIGIILNLVGISPLIYFVHLSELGFSFISTAFAQATTTTTHQPTPVSIVYIVYVVLLAMLAVAFYISVILKSASTTVRDTWKTLLGFFTGVITK
jgi:tetrahydromethanopterin S-methyltransferase subunit G